MSDAAQDTGGAGAGTGAAVRSWINHGTEIVDGPSPSLVRQLVEAGQPFWLDIENPTDEIIDRLAARLGLHPLAVEDSKQFGQRGKLQIYGSVVMMVGFGLDQQMREPVEVHCYYTTRFLITLHRAPSPALDALRREASVRPLLETDPVQAVHRLVSSLHAPFPEFVLGLDERLDALEQRVLREADDDDLTEITGIRHQAAAMRQALTPGRDLTHRMPLILSLPGATPETRMYVEDLSDELQRFVADLTAIEERCITLLSLQASLSGNHLAVVSRRLATVATIFLPISFLAGFWGENFNVLTGTIEKGWPAFLILSVGLTLACILVTTFILSRRGWT
ncbi:MAG TPA: magnesium transporter CorA family protein [Candidatus Dormibacteraeota bacterium]|nr:magnesium transporter CorA family protein [Candidatus Dormibacteraeota bacterium]HKA97509.1 magnesium transporter CorA family protein [Streptosporangiaceae bacterium]